MNRHHPYVGMYEGARRGSSPSGPGPDRSHGRFFERGGGHPPRGRARGRGGHNTGNHYGGSGPGGGYGQGAANFDSATPDSYNQWNASAPPDPYYGQSAGYANNIPPYPPYNDEPDGYADQSYGSYEDSGRGGRGGKRGAAATAAPPRRERDDKVHDSLIEERIMRERPCRTLFIRNIKYETNSDDVRRKFEDHGEIKTFFDLIANRGMVFVTYFDLRAAERARERLQDTEISGRPIDVHYSLPRPDEQGNKEPKERNQGTLLVTLRNSASGQPIDDNEVRRKFQQFGDVKNVKPGENVHDQRYVEYFDTRGCDEAYDRLRHQSLQDGIMDVIFSSDIPDVPLPPGPLPARRPDERPQRSSRDYEEPPTRGRRGGRGGRGRGGPPRDDWDDRRGGGGDWDRDGDRNRRYRDDYEGGGRGRGRGRGGGYNGDRFDDRGAYGGGPPPPHNSYGGPGPSGPPPHSYGQPNGGPPLPPAPPVDERLEQARKVQQLLAALKQPQASGPPQPGPPAMPGPPPHMPPGVPSYYPPPPSSGMAGAPHMYPGPPPPMANPYGAPPPPVPQPSTPQQSAAAAPSQAPPTSLAGLPPNILAMLQQAAQGSPPPPPPPAGLPHQMAPPGMPPYGMPSTPTQPSVPAAGPASQDYQQLMAFLQAQAASKR
ncbi:hypothetical protein DFH11DRAFT_1619149 [Phellopilus nigrolimitatus]|nr:hypothetical protein DFH11DRAFT_1619149 [Phellopilus nigrolimitatus]